MSGDIVTAIATVATAVGSVLAGSLTVAWKLGGMSRSISDLVERFDRHEVNHNGKASTTAHSVGANMVVCSHCGAALVARSVICPRCGSELASIG